MKTHLHKYFLALTLVSSQAFAGSVQDMMWGLRNNGQMIHTSINPLQTYRLQAVVGEDIRLMMPVVRGRKVKVAVVDTGVDLSHPQLSPAILSNPGKCEAYTNLKQCLEQPGADVQACRAAHLQSAPNVYPGDCHGWSILDQDLQPTPNGIIGRPDFTDNSGHGTHVAGIITSVSPNAEIIPVQVVGEGPNQPIKPFSLDLSPSENIRQGYSTDLFSERVARGIIYAMNSGAEVISMSIGWPENQNTDIAKEAIAEAQRRGIIVIAAAGNDSTSALLRPCQYKGVICVGAHAPDGSLASFSNFGFGVDIAAPGVEIISTIPMTSRSVKIPGTRGYDILSGTSQAAPFVTGVVAEMLSRGIPSRDIYARLMVGARAVKAEKPVLVGPNLSTAQAVNAAPIYKKTVLSGLLDMTQAMQVQEQPLILPANKDVQVINWDRQSKNMRFNLALKNFWQSISGARIQILARPTQNSDIEAQVVQITGQQGLNSWARGEEKNFAVHLTLKDQSDATLSRVPSELSYQIFIYVNGVLHRQFEQKAEIVVNVGIALAGHDVESFNLNGQIPREMKLTLVDEVLDQKVSQRDYFVIGKDDEKEGYFNIGLVRHVGQNYNVEHIQNLKFEGNLNLTRPQYKVRVDLDGDGKTEYVYGLIEYLDAELTIYGDYRNHFYIFDDQMNLKQTVLYDDKRVMMPYTFYWMKINGKLRPAWVAKGQEVITTVDLLDVLGTDGTPQDVANAVRTPEDLHFYYLDEQFKLKQLEAPSRDQRIVDVIQPSADMAQKGELTVLIARNLGTQVKPSYINEFSVATVSNGRLQSSRLLNSLGAGIDYRNLVDTFADKTMSLKSEAKEFRGMMWYGLDAGQRQRVTMLDLDTNQITDRLIESQRKVHDSALLVKAGFQSPTRQGAFLITNSELEYHDISTNQVASMSLDRYSFFGDATFVEVYFPITLINSENPSEKLPALFTTERSGLSRGMRLVTGLYSAEGKLQQLVTPARLRLKADSGCKPLESPVFLGEQKGFAMDYQCGSKIMRILMRY